MLVRAKYWAVDLPINDPMLTTAVQKAKEIAKKYDISIDVWRNNEGKLVAFVREGTNEVMVENIESIEDLEKEVAKVVTPPSFEEEIKKIFSDAVVYFGPEFIEVWIPNINIDLKIEYGEITKENLDNFTAFLKTLKNIFSS